MKKISVVIPYFNDSKYIRHALESVLNQTFSVDEVIIIDDNSMDSHDLLTIVSSFNSDIIKVYRNDINLNGAASRNIGIKKSTGDIICLLDADDFWRADHVEKSISALKYNKASFVYSNVVELSLDGREHKRAVTCLSDITNKMHKNNIVLMSPPQTNSFVFCKEMLRDVHFDEQLRRHQDYQFFLDVINNEGVKSIYMDEYTTYYRLRDFKNKPIIDFDSIFKFWHERRQYLDSSLLNKKIWNIVAGALRDKRVNAKELVSNKYLSGILHREMMYKIISKVNNDLFSLVFVNVYFYIIIDRCHQLTKKIRSYI